MTWFYTIHEKDPAAELAEWTFVQYTYFTVNSDGTVDWERGDTAGVYDVETWTTGIEVREDGIYMQRYEDGEHWAKLELQPNGYLYIDVVYSEGEYRQIDEHTVVEISPEGYTCELAGRVY